MNGCQKSQNSLIAVLITGHGRGIISAAVLAKVKKMRLRRRKDLPECWAGECLSCEEEIRKRFAFVKKIQSRSGGKVFYAVEAREGFHAFVEMNGKYYATSSYHSLEDLEDYIF